MTERMEAAEVTLPSDREVEIARSFRAPRERVYRAYTEPALLRRWLLGPPGWSMPVCEMDVREGGMYRWRWRAEAGDAEFGLHGEFREVDPPKRLKHTQVYDPGDTGGSPGDMGDGHSVVTLAFEERHGLTTVTTRIDYGSRESRDAALSTGVADGMEASYRDLDTLLDGNVEVGGADGAG